MKEGTAIESAMVRHDGLTEGVLATQHDRASHLANQMKAGVLQGADTVSAGEYRKVRHTVTRTESKRSSGTGRLSASNAVTYAGMASLILDNAASCVSP